MVQDIGGVAAELQLDTLRGGAEGAAKLSHILCSTYLVLVPAIAHHIFQRELY